ncbi:hypothetical protein J4460_08660 [Candidatus Woesearchaeota archaeon]|nr:MAG: hypothetical protein QS99_C0013G0033 [archaeon GW2011_AR4]MBS3130709.1 hypothetical protein [Candidatus Woesearchaeota archaeon]HIH38828.1 hypothetical protein [Candidatus Woesearchaeota archaeon]HIJ04349.1 hypothetical protein [Candidatus Woesearchaeota archaeon]
MSSSSKEDAFKKYLILALILLGLFLLINKPEAPIAKTDGDLLEIDFFYLPTCPHCNAQEPFNQELEDKYPIRFISRNIQVPAEKAKMDALADKAGIPESERGVPFTVIGDHFIIGFSSKETTGEKLRKTIELVLAGKEEEAANLTQEEEEQVLPFIGKLDTSKYSLTGLSIVLGLVDGFNPCAMWMLMYLIGLVMTLQDKKKIWVIVGTFVAAEGILYFMFMTAWLNVFLFVGFLRPVSIVIGLIALGVGILDLRDYKKEDPLVCDVGDYQTKKKTISKMEKIVHSPLTWASFLGIVVLAFVVNAFEFVCSSGIPAVYTQVLALHNLPSLQYYMYILIYDIFYMLDDFIIFAIAAFALNSSLGDKYGKYSKLIGGLILAALGIVLLFFPQLLH